MFRTETSTPGMLAPDGSRTSPAICPLFAADCENNEKGRHTKVICKTARHSIGRKRVFIRYLPPFDKRLYARSVSEKPPGGLVQNRPTFRWPPLPCPEPPPPVPGVCPELQHTIHRPRAWCILDCRYIP